MKRLFIFALSLIVAVSFGFTWTSQASAVERGTQNISQPINTASDEYKEHEVLVMFKTGDTMSAKAAQNKLRSGDGAIKDIKVVESWDFEEASKNAPGDGANKKGADTYTNVALVKSSSLSTEQMIKKLQERDDVLYAEPNYRIHALSVSSDPYSDLQWSMQEEASNTSFEWDALEAAGKEKGTDAIVAVVDTGVDYEHDDLRNNMWQNTHYPTLHGECGWDFSKGDDDPMDENGHGTHCAGIIGAEGDNGVGISGVNQKVRIMALRILDEDGSGWNSEEIAAYNYISKALDLGEPVKAINNSWGGGDYSDIFAKLIDIVGEKGAVSVFAAGNEGSNNDQSADYPSGIESDYKIVVAATKQDNELVSFSNYGVNSVDVAAPGTDILSTVCYACYNPSIYTDDEQAVISRAYNGFEGEDVWGIPTDDDVSFTDEGATYSAALTDEGVNGSKSMRLSFKDMKAGSAAFISLPYTLGNAKVTDVPHFSMMAKADTEKDDYSFLVSMDLPVDEELSLSSLDDHYLYGYYLSKDQDYWNHYDMSCLSEEDTDNDVAPERKIVIALYSEGGGDCDIILDDLGISYENIDTSLLGKYDFMSGTSMATPFITGAVALKAAELGNADATTVISETVALAKNGSEEISGKIIADGAFDFSMKPDYLPPRIGSIKIASVKNGTIQLSGSGFYEGSLKVEISYAGRDEYVEVEDLSVSEDHKTITFKDDGWINNLIDIKVTGYNNKTVKKENVYLVKGKKSFTTAVKDTDYTEGGKVITDGKKFYTTINSTDSILAVTPSGLDYGYDTVATLDYKKLFNTKNNSSTAMYDMLFSRDLATIKGYIYAVVEYGQAIEEPVDYDDWFFFSNSGKAVKAMDADDDDDDDMFAGNGVLYSSEGLKLVRINPSTGAVKDLGSLPNALKTTIDWSMTAYKGKIYFVGGYDQKNKEFNKDVRIFDPFKSGKNSEKWSVKKDALPEGRAGGHVIQSGTKLFYTLGYGESQKGISEEEQACPKNLVFNGTSWAKKGETLYPFDAADVVKRGADKYVKYDGNIGICKGGIVYIGTPVEDYGDTFTFTYNSSSKKWEFKDTGYNYSTTTEAADINATTLGKKIYTLDENGVNTAPITSGFIYIKYSKVKNGKVTGVNRYYNPGDKATIVAKANKKYKIASFKVGTKTIKLKKKATKKTYVTGPLSKNLTVKAKFKKK